LLSAYLDGELTGEDMLGIRAHLEDCSYCAKEHTTLLETKRLVASLAYKAPRADLEALLLCDAARRGRSGLTQSIAAYFTEEPASGLRLRPLAATILLSLAGLWLASTALDVPGDSFLSGDRVAAFYPLAPPYVSPAALPATETTVTAWGTNQGSAISSVVMPRALLSSGYAGISIGVPVLARDLKDTPAENSAMRPVVSAAPGVITVWTAPAGYSNASNSPKAAGLQ
jgi:predicted anti-sigma-YlaC factor YlaD